MRTYLKSISLILALGLSACGSDGPSEQDILQGIQGGFSAAQEELAYLQSLTKNTGKHWSKALDRMEPVSVEIKNSVMTGTEANPLWETSSIVEFEIKEDMFKPLGQEHSRQEYGMKRITFTPVTLNGKPVVEQTFKAGETVDALAVTHAREKKEGFSVSVKSISDELPDFSRLKTSADLGEFLIKGSSEYQAELAAVEEELVARLSDTDVVLKALKDELSTLVAIGKGERWVGGRSLGIFDSPFLSSAEDKNQWIGRDPQSLLAVVGINEKNAAAVTIGGITPQKSAVLIEGATNHSMEREFLLDIEITQDLVELVEESNVPFWNDLDHSKVAVFKDKKPSGFSISLPFKLSAYESKKELAMAVRPRDVPQTSLKNFAASDDGKTLLQFGSPEYKTKETEFAEEKERRKVAEAARSKRIEKILEKYNAPNITNANHSFSRLRLDADQFTYLGVTNTNYAPTAPEKAVKTKWYGNPPRARLMEAGVEMSQLPISSFIMLKITRRGGKYAGRYFVEILETVPAL